MATGAVVQFRLMGGVIGLAIVTAVLNGFVRSHLSQFLSQDEITNLLQTQTAFDNVAGPDADLVREIFAAAFNVQMRVVIGISAAQIPFSLLLWKKPQLVII